MTTGEVMRRSAAQFAQVLPILSASHQSRQTNSNNIAQCMANTNSMIQLMMMQMMQDAGGQLPPNFANMASAFGGMPPPGFGGASASSSSAPAPAEGPGRRTGTSRGVERRGVERSGTERSGTRTCGGFGG